MTYEAATSVWAILEAFLTPHSSVSPTANGLLLVAVVTAACAWASWPSGSGAPDLAR